MKEIKNSIDRHNIVAIDHDDSADFIATLDCDGTLKRVNVRLEGVILGEQVNMLRTFLAKIKDHVGDEWLLLLEDLHVISHRGLRVILEFAKVIRQRGYEVEIKSIQMGVLAVFLELDLCQYFKWDEYEVGYGEKPGSQTFRMTPSVQALGETF
ncbi:hypothetical protein MJD09_17430 [bacterium]|nr:hypothetical protein [bacterium]